MLVYLLNRYEYDREEKPISHTLGVYATAEEAKEAALRFVKQGEVNDYPFLIETYFVGYEYSRGFEYFRWWE